MKIIRGILPLSLLLLASCGPAKAVKVRSAPVAQPAAAQKKIDAPLALPPLSKVEPAAAYTVTNFENTGSAVEHIFKAEKDLQVIAFGEMHKTKGSNLKSTLNYFAQEIMPVLIKHGIADIVWEHLPSGEKAHKELKIFKKTGKLGPLLSKWFAYHADYCGVIEVLKGAIALEDAAKDLKVKLHGCHAAGLEEYYGNLLNMSELVKKRALAITRSLLEQGDPVAIYTGAIHNNIEPFEGLEERNFGQTLRSELGSGYIEVDIYVPELVQPGKEKYLSLQNMDSLIPEKGVNLVDFDNGRYVLVLARATEPVVPHLPEKAPVCP